MDEPGVLAHGSRLETVDVLAKPLRALADGVLVTAEGLLRKVRAVLDAPGP